MIIFTFTDNQEVVNTTRTAVPSNFDCPYKSPPVMLECPDSVKPTLDPTESTSGAAPLHVITVFTVIMMMMMVALLF